MKLPNLCPRDELPFLVFDHPKDYKGYSQLALMLIVIGTTASKNGIKPLDGTWTLVVVNNVKKMHAKNYHISYLDVEQVEQHIMQEILEKWNVDIPLGIFLEKNGYSTYTNNAFKQISTLAIEQFYGPLFYFNTETISFKSRAVFKNPRKS